MDKDAIALLDLVERIAQVLRSEMRRKGNAQKLQPVHLQALLYLKQANRYSNTPQALTEYLGLTKGTVSQTLLLLHRRGLIKRFMDETDRRVVRLGLSWKGERLLQQLQFSEDWIGSSKNINPARLEISEMVLREILHNFQAGSGGGTFGICRSCSHFRIEGQRIYRCGLTGERLSVGETRRICREHLPVR